LLFDPGDRWFSGINVDWAGKMVEAVSGKRHGTYLQDNLFAPLGMPSTAFKITPAMRERLAKIHQRGDIRWTWKVRKSRNSKWAGAASMVRAAIICASCG
jgi:CubicO group peptidase (beta-lactamase class C family)